MEFMRRVPIPYQMGQADYLLGEHGRLPFDLDTKDGRDYVAGYNNELMDCLAAVRSLQGTYR